MKHLKDRNVINDEMKIDVLNQSERKNKFVLLHDYKDNLSSEFYYELVPEKIKDAQPVIVNRNLIHELNLDEEEVMEKLDILSLKEILEGEDIIAQAYGGSQFGHYTRLGDGRAALLGEIDIDGELFDIHLKGTGRTAYSRGGDGKAAIGPMIREYVVSEYMHSLNIPTTRALSVFITGENVYREKVNNGALLARVAKSHIRVGTFQYIKEAYGDEKLKELADYTIKRHYPQLLDVKEEKYTKFLRNVLVNQASLIAKWMASGFIHGVMNTDNTTLSGETIDYGPCAFMEGYDKDQVFSSIDRNGRYRYINQPNIGMWNLGKLYESMYDLLLEEGNTIDSVKYELEQFASYYRYFYMKEFGYKLGIKEPIESDEDLITGFLDLLESKHYDFTNSFRDLTYYMMGKDEKINQDSVINDEKFSSWFEKYKERIRDLDGNEIVKLMKKHNPVIIPRNLVLDEALNKADEKDFSLVFELLSEISSPFNYDKEVNEKYTKVMSEEETNKFMTYCGT